ncbi:membrane dipeptidase [Vagococcus xieshaowenii]|uniref:Membrane dipeptidase n=2 Tax=Vagococcus xieshaowenii TaxID=2562451 RepID=A0AAJ5EFX9_9ENTE|nr:membrane dipeptidase [Vagococcus xieshaowenii]TFZ41288.1 membrane dipeptidase [Vagococcus xieshaowenii]
MKAIDLHCDTITRIDGTPENSLFQNHLQIDLQKMKESGTILQNFAIYLDKATTPNLYDSCHHYIDLYERELKKNREHIAPVLSYQDYLTNQEHGKLSSLLTMEEGAPLEGRIDYLEEFYQRGVRMLTLTWNYQNELGYPNSLFVEEKSGLLSTYQKGLTPVGIDIIQRMNQLGMIIDVSHGSDQLVNDVLTYTDRPFVASHSNAREVTYHSRNLPDDLIKAISERGGIIGLNYCENFLRKPNDTQPLVHAIACHAKHLKQVGGIECIALGSDFDGIPVNEELKDIRSITKIAQALSQAGFSTTEIEKIFYQNVERLYKELL